MKHLASIVLIFLSVTSINAQTNAPTEPADTFDVTLSELSGELYLTPVNKILMPRVFSGYRHLTRHPRHQKFMDPNLMKEIRYKVW